MKRNLKYDINAQATDCGRSVERRAFRIGMACIAVGLLVSFVAIIVRGDTEFSAEQQTITVLACLGMCLISFGVGWHCREEYDKDGVWR